MKKSKHIILLLFLTTCNVFLLKAQQSTCKDSIVHYIISGKDIQPFDDYGFGYYQAIDRNNNLYFPFAKGLPNKPTLLKLNSDNKLLWAKTYILKLFSGFGKFETFDGPSFVTKSNNILLGGSAYKPYGSEVPCNLFSLLSLDSSGEMRWKKLYTGISAEQSTGANPICEGQNNDIVLLPWFKKGPCYTDEVDNNYYTALLDSNGWLKWSKIYGDFNLPKFHKKYEPVKNIINTGNSLVLLGNFYYDAEDYNYESNGKDGFFLSKLNYNNGRVLNTKAFTFLNKDKQLVHFSIQNINYDSVSQKILVKGEAFLQYKIRHLIAVLDTNFKVEKTLMFSRTLPEGWDLGPFTEKTFISRDNNLVFWYEYERDTSITYATVNSNLEITSQRKIKLKSIYPFHNYFESDVILDNNHLLHFKINSIHTASSNKLFLLNASPFYGTENPCFGYDTSLYIKEDITLVEIPMQLANRGDFPLVVTEELTAPSVPLDIDMLEICKQKSICDTIKIHGQVEHCFSNPFASFSLYKNPNCLRKTEWSFDTSAIKIINKQNDTTIQVKFLKPFTGFIYAGFAGCMLKDSFKVTVYQPKTGVNLGNDTAFCPSPVLTLHAGKGYKNYKWQDGSTNEFLNVTKPGIYFVRATDSCKNIFTDTLIVDLLKSNFNINFAGTLCQGDTARIFLPESIKNISWNPFESGNINDKFLYLFPSATTLYLIKGEANINCFLSDTILIKVNQCPQSIFFPNAFTPNNDGLNDFYKPAVFGKLISYEFTIYNRWGQAVFKTNDSSKGWDGKRQHNNNISGTYVWVCKYQFFKKSAQTKKGTVVLLK